MSGIVILGTDTDVGKTIASAVLLKTAFRAFGHARYFKPVQTFIEEECDYKVVKSFFTNEENIQASHGLSFRRPLSPHLAAHYQNTSVCFKTVLDMCKKELDKGYSIVETAGGALSPLTFRHTMRDLAIKLDVPVVIIARSSLGTINHSLLTIENLRACGITIKGVMMVGHKNRDNEESVKYFSGIKNVISMPYFKNLNKNALNTFVVDNAEKLKLFI